MLKDLFNSAQNSMKQFANKNFMNAVVASAALVAFADGSVSSEEKSKIAGHIQRNEKLKVFKSSDLINQFNEIVNNLEFDFITGRNQALGYVKKLSRGSQDAIMCVSIATSIANSDNNFDSSEKKIVTELCDILGLDVTQYI